MNIKNVFKLKKAEASDKKLSRAAIFRHGGYSVAVIAIVLVAVVLLNVLFTALADRVNLTLDLSFTGENSLSEENTEFLKGIENDVTLTVCANREDYVEALDYYASNGYGFYDGADFYEQTLNLLSLYVSANPKIKIEYLDLASTAGSAITGEFPSIFYGDIIVSAVDSSGATNKKVVGFSDIYAYEDASGSGYYNYVTANKLETALSSAINHCVTNITKKAALLANCSNAGYFDALFASQLKLNGFELSEITDKTLTKIPEGIEQLYLVAPTRDMLAEELAVINNWLYNGGNRGRSLIFIPGDTVSNIPNIVEFMKEWGVSYSDGMLYETNAANYSGHPIYLDAFNNTTELKIANEDKYYRGGFNFPMNVTYETYSTRETNVIISTSDTVVAAPLGIKEDWRPDESYVQQNYPILVVTEDNDVVGDELKSSYVASFSSVEFIYSQQASLPQFGNMEAAINTATFAAGFDNETRILFLDKTVTTETFADKVTDAGIGAIQIIFMIAIPLTLVVAGFVVWLRRKNR